MDSLCKWRGKLSQIPVTFKPPFVFIRFRFTTRICPRKVRIVVIVDLFRIVSAFGISQIIKMLPYFVQILYREAIALVPISPLPPGGGGLGWGGSYHEDAKLLFHPPPAPLPSREGEMRKK